MSVFNLAPLILLGLTSTVEANIFQDIRPKSYSDESILDIHVGQLYSPWLTKSYKFYYLPYCTSTTSHHFWSEDDTTKEVGVPDYIPGVFSYEDNLHESFFTVSKSDVSYKHFSFLSLVHCGSRKASKRNDLSQKTYLKAIGQVQGSHLG